MVNRSFLVLLLFSFSVIVVFMGADGNGCSKYPAPKTLLTGVIEFPIVEKVTIRLEYKPNSIMEDNKKSGSFYYIVRYTVERESLATRNVWKWKFSDIDQIVAKHEEPLDESFKNPVRSPDKIRKLVQSMIAADIHRNTAFKHLHPDNWDLFKEIYMEIGGDVILREWLRDGCIKIAFYDKNGNSLLATRDKTFLPGLHPHTYEEGQDGDTLEWKGQFYEDWLTLENFRDIDHATVTYAR